MDVHVRLYGLFTCITKISTNHKFVVISFFEPKLNKSKHRLAKMFFSLYLNISVVLVVLEFRSVFIHEKRK